MYFIGENGSYIAKGAKLISTNTLKKEQVQAVIQLVEKHPELNMILCGVKSAYCLNEFKHLEPVVRTYYCNYQFVESYDDIDDEIMKIAIYDPNHQIIRYADDIACGGQHPLLQFCSSQSLQLHPRTEQALLHGGAQPPCRHAAYARTSKGGARTQL